MRLSVFTDVDWLYPDSLHNDQTRAVLDAVCGGHAGVQILGDISESDVVVDFKWNTPDAPAVELFELLPVGVNENTAPTTMTTTNYELCREYVTRKAPFYVYDALRPIDGALSAGKRLALYLCVEIPQGFKAGEYEGVLSVNTSNSESSVRIVCQVHALTVPELKDAKLSMLNFFSYDWLAILHNVENNSDEYWEIFREYVRAQIEMRCTHIILPQGDAIVEDGVLTGFDFSAAERAGQIACEEGAYRLCGTHVARWHSWDGSEYYPIWDKSVSVTSSEGYLQMKMYFTQWAQIIERNGWQKCMTQALADEPQTNNQDTYRVLASMCRKFLPNIPIIDAVETTNLGGGIDVWVPKQETYEKWRNEYEILKTAGEEMWFYTCAFPAGPAMNRSMDIPLTVSRLVIWMTATYRLSGYLHWGFNYYIGDDIWNSACCPHKGALLPAGDAHIVYPGDGKPWRSMRFEAQRGGAEDYELLAQALAVAPKKTDEIISSVCTDHLNYTRDGENVLSARREIIRLLERAK